MKNFKLVIAYDGAKYKGWQKLGGEDADKTVQGKIEAVLSKCYGRPIEINGASRTDAGVHAREQIANFKIKTDMHPLDVAAYLRAYLPEDIAIKNVQEMDLNFHARFQAKSKTYCYQIWATEVQDPFLRKYMWHIPQKLNVEAMNEAAQAFVGTHDFTTFTNAKSKKKSMERTIEKVEVKKEGALLTIRVTGDGFLHNMVRKMVGMLVGVGQGELTTKQVMASIAAKDRGLNSPLAPSLGLFLEKVNY
jgi:tRNA pseudouridine38-40 synthase